MKQVVNSPDRSETSKIKGSFCAWVGMRQTSSAGVVGRQPTRLPRRAVSDLTAIGALLVVVLLANPRAQPTTPSIEGLVNDQSSAILRKLRSPVSAAKSV